MQTAKAHHNARTAVVSETWDPALWSIAAVVTAAIVYLACLM